MFGIKTLAVTPESAIKAATTRTLKGADEAGVARYNAVRDYVALAYAADRIEADLTQRAYDMLKDTKDTKSRDAVRDEFKHVYAADYAARFPKNPADKRKAAVDMAWSRVMARAESKGWVKPVSQTKTASKARGARAAAKATSGKIDGRKDGNNAGKGKTQAAQANATSAIVASVADKADPEMSAALAWVNSSANHRAAFLAWFKTQKAAELSGAAQKAA